jgi:hypothetical protein
MIALALSAVLATSSCSGADPAIVSATSRLASNANQVERYTITVTVRNVGRMKQASNVLQYVAMYQNDVKTDTHGIRPLKPGQSYTVTFAIQRASETEAHSTHLRFELGFRSPTQAASADCNLQNNSYTLEV